MIESFAPRRFALSWSTPMNDTTSSGQTAAAMTPLKGLLMLGNIILFVAAFVALNYWIGIADFWAGFLFVLYWSSVEHLQEERLPHSIVGAVTGLLVSFAMQTLPHTLGTAGILIPLAAILGMIYCQVMGWLPMVVNTATMLFLTVATMPLLQTHGNFVSIFSGLGMGVAFFVTLVVGGSRLMAKFAKPAAQTN